MNLRSQLYRGARLLGDVQAVARGRIIQRLANKAIGRNLGRFYLQDHADAIVVIVCVVGLIVALAVNR